MLYLELKVIVRSQMGVVPTTIYTYKAPFTKESQGTVHLDFKMSVGEDSREQQQT